MPVHAVNFEFLSDQIVSIPDNHPVCIGVQIDHVPRTRRATGEAFALADRKQLNSIMLANEISSDVVNVAAMKVVTTQVRA
jgi:hypothetical protein